MPNAEARILALTASIERIESRWPNGRRTDLSTALRRQRGAWKLYRDGIFTEPPQRYTGPMIIETAPCPQMDLPQGERHMTALEGYYLGSQNEPDEHFGDTPAEVIARIEPQMCSADADRWILKLSDDRLLHQWPVAQFQLEHLEPATEALETVEAAV